MNLTKLKTYAPAGRNAIITAVTRRAAVLGIQPGRVEEVTESGDVALIGGQPFPRSIVPLRKKLLEIIHRDGFDHTMEAMAYTWFNRLVALRFMELHDGYLDHGYRVLSHPQGTPLPEILQHAEHVELKSLDRDEVIRLKLDGTRDEELYRLLLLAQCAELNHILPDVFSKLDDATILLLPDNLLHSDSIIRQLVAGSDPEDWQQVEVLGWLYQFYISEKKDAVMARKSAVPTDDIPAVTQLFTPHWIVRYLVENSLGRLWMQNRPNSKLVDHMPYYIADTANPDGKSSSSNPNGIASSSPGLPGTGYPGSDAPPDSNPTGVASSRETAGASGRNPVGVENELNIDPQGSSFLATLGFGTESLQDSNPSGVQLGDSPAFLKINRPEEIRLCDPAVGSGHMLTYAFDLLTLIYEEEGYAANDIPGLILKHNLHGLDLCPRAAQLAELALVFKAREKSRRFFQPEHLVRPRIIELRDVRFAENELRDYIHALGLGDLFNQPMLRLLHQFEEAKTFGSLIQPCLDERAIAFARRAIEAKDLGGQLFLRETHLKVLRVLEQAEALTQRYHVVVANPPYMGTKGMNGSLKQYAKDSYPDSKPDLFSMFMERGFSLALPMAYTGMITMQSWMFLSSYEALRMTIVSTKSILSMAHLGPRAFDTIAGEVVQSTAFVLANALYERIKSSFFRLVDGSSESEKSTKYLEANSNRECGWFFSTSVADFKKVPGSPIAYWLSDTLASSFVDLSSLSKIAPTRQGLATGDNEAFLRQWFEVGLTSISFNATSSDDTLNKSERWYPCNKGGEFRKWYGNECYVVDWLKGGTNIKEDKLRRLSQGLILASNSKPKNEQYYFLRGLTWSAISSSSLSMRYSSAGHVFETKGAMCFPQDEDIWTVLAFTNCIVVNQLLLALSPTLDFHEGPVGKLPIKMSIRGVDAEPMVTIAKFDWDNFETSWDFRDQPLLRSGLKGATLEASWRNWETQSIAAIRRMQELETENNRLFIAAYGLDGELQPEVAEAQITLARADTRRDMAAFLSYAVGCMMGRFSLDAPGLILANAGDTVADYARVVAEKRMYPNPNGIESTSPGLLGTSYPGSNAPPETNPDGVASVPGLARHNPVGVENLFDSDSQGSASRATLGFGPESLWDRTAETQPLILHPSTFIPDQDGILPVLDGEWFEDDLVARTKDFLRATFDDATLAENLRFIEKSLGRDLRDYFLTDFYKDHLQTYKNRPIYWLFSSGKQKAFQCLVYLHRYTPATLARIRTEYAIPLQGKLSARITRLEEETGKATASTARKKLQTELDKSKKQMVELLAYDEQLRSYADQSITLDLDDGVKTNYARFGPLVAESKKVCGTKED